MVKKAFIATVITCIIFSFAFTGITVSAGENTTYTYTVSVDDEWIRTQDAYRSGRVYLQNSGLAKPKDLFYRDERLYIADSGNGRIVVLDLKSGEISYIGEGCLVNPTGVFVCEDKTVYVADPDIPAVVCFAPDGSERGRILRPDSYLFNEQSVYQPKNVVVTSQGNIFVVGQGAYQGLMQFDREGVFQGYFAANKRKLTALESLQELIFTDKQKDQLLSRVPRSIENIDLADRDMIFSVTQDDNKDSAAMAGGKIQNYLKLHNMTGINVLAMNSSMNEEWNFTDVAFGTCDNVLALTATGLIYEYDKSGNLLFSFGGRAVSSDRAGLFTSASAIDVDENGIIYVLDGERGRIQTFFPTEFASVTHKAIYELSEGNYVDSEEIWSSVLKLNGNSSIAHLGYGKALLYQGEYKEAMRHFKICRNKEYYSQAFWEIRSRWMNKYMSLLFIGLAVVYVTAKLIGYYRKKSGRITRKIARNGQLSVMKKMLFHPIDTYYDLKCGKCGSVYSASWTYLACFGVFVCDMLVRSYLFKRVDISSFPIFSIPVMFFVPLFLWIFGNRMVSSICEGEGTFKNIYITTAYAFTPYLVITPALIVLTYFLSLNEQFLITLIAFVALVWTGVLLVIGIMQIHNYSLRQTIKNILLILFFMIMAIVTLVILYLIWTQVFGYLYDLFGELNYNLFRR